MIRVHVHDGITNRTFDVFEESKHPRDPKGEFTAGAGGSAPKNSVYTYPWLHKALAEGGYAKTKAGSSEMIQTYEHPSGHKVSVHHYSKAEAKPEGAGFVSHPTGGLKQAKKGEAAKELIGYLKAVSERQGGSEKPISQLSIKEMVNELKDEPGMTHYGVAPQLIEKGYKFAKPPAPGPLTLQKGKSLVTVDPKTAKWVASSQGHIAKKGEGVESLNALLEGKSMSLSIPPIHWQNVPNEEMTWEHVMNQQGEYNPNDPSNAGKEAQFNTAKENWKKAAEIQAAEQLAASQAAAEKLKSIPTSHHNPYKLQSILSQAGGEKYAKAAENTPVPDVSEASAVSSYTGNAYGVINDCLRNKENCGSYLGTIKQIEKYLAKGKLPAMTLHRGIRGEYAKVIRSIAMEGMVFQEKGFMSTSSSEEFAQSWSGGEYSGKAVTMDIEIPDGTPGAAVTHIGQAGAAEQEILLQKNRVLKVTHWDPVKGHMKVQLVNPE